jgi:acyl-CoA thioester hydrolase
MYTYSAEVYFDDLDPNGHLHNAKYGLYVERAVTAALAHRGFDTTRVSARDEDLRYVVRHFEIEFLAEVRQPQVLSIVVQLSSIGVSSSKWTFSCYLPDGKTVSARGNRTIVKVDSSGRPVGWSRRLREAFSSDSAAGAR